MHSTTLLLLVSSSVALAARSPVDVRYFDIYPAQKCQVTAKTDLCKNPSKGIEPCGDGTYCSAAACGTWAGMKGMCCNGTPDTSFKGTVSEQLAQACKPFADALKNYNTNTGSTPINKGCDDHSKYYPTGTSAGDGLDIFTGNKTVADFSCCSLDNDSVTVFSDFLSTVSSSKCISPLGGSKSSGSGSSGSSSSGSSKSGGMTVTPSVGGAVASLFVAILAGVVGAGML